MKSESSEAVPEQRRMTNSIGDLSERFRRTQLSRRRLLQSALAAGGGAVTAALAGPTLDAARAASSQNVAIYTSAVDIPSLDSASASGHDEATGIAQKSVYDTLYRHIGNPAKAVPWLATEYTASADAKEWTFKLDPKAKFQDGSPVTADAVVYSLQRLLKLNQGVAYMFSGIMTDKGVTAVDPHTVKFTLNQPFAPFLHATTWLMTLNPAVVKQHDKGGDIAKAWLQSNAAGSGPFKISRWESGNLYQFDADPNYWKGWDGAHVDGWVHQVSQESATKRIALQQGKAQFANWLSPQDKAQLEKDANVVVPKETSITTYTIKMNTASGPTSDVHVRRAISYAFDYKAMIDVMSGFGTRLKGPVPPSILPDASLTGYDTDLDKAKAELAQSAKYKDGFDIEFMYVTGLDEERKTGLILLDQLSKLNIKVKVTAVEWSNAVPLFADPTKSPQLFPIYSGNDYPDPDNYLYQSYHSSSAGTWMGADQYKNPDLDKLLVQGRSTTDAATRTKVYTQAQKMIVDDAVEVFAFLSIEGLPHRKEVQGYNYCPVMGSDPWWYGISLKQ